MRHHADGAEVERRGAPWVALLVLGGFLLVPPAPAGAMGDLGDSGATHRIPEPSLSYRVRVTDTEMTRFEVEKASFDGHIFLTGTIGKASVSIPFDKIGKVIFEPDADGETLAIVTLVSGEQQTLHVRGRTPCYGIASFGNVAILLKDLRDATFLGRADKPAN